MANTPLVSFTTVGNLCDILRDLPLASPTDYHLDGGDETMPNKPIQLVERNQLDNVNSLLNSNDSYLIEILNQTLSQIDTSKIMLKAASAEQQQPHRYPPVLRNLVTYNPKLFNGALNDQFLKQQQPPPPHATVLQQHQLNENQNQMYSSINPQEIQNVRLMKPAAEQSAAAAPVGIKPEKKDDPMLSANKFYSNSSKSVNQQQQPLPPPKQTPIQPTKKEENSSSKSASKKRGEKKSTNNLLNTWQADITSQLDLPQDFTPELISQLAAEGYDVISATGRKGRSRQHSTIVNSINSIIDSSDEEEATAASGGGGGEDFKPATKNTPRKQQQEAAEAAAKSRLDRASLMKNLQNLNEPTEHPSFKRFNQILDDVLESFEQDLQDIKLNKNKNSSKKKSKNKYHQQDDEEEDDDDDNEIPPECLLSRQLCSEIVQEAFKLNTYGFMNLIRRDCLLKLQNLLYYNIKDGLRPLSFGNEELAASSSNAEQEKMLREILVEKLLRASDCSIISLIIMTSPKISKELIIEDVIEQIAMFVKNHLTETIFPFYDSVYKVAAIADVNSAATANKSGNTTKKKLLTQFATATNSSSAASLNKTKQMQHFYNRMKEILSILADLVCQIDMTDTIVITLTSLSVMCFFVENINDLQLEALKILTNIFTRYSKHRQLIFDDILSSLIKLHPTKRNARSYKCFNGDSIQMFSALILQLIQCEVNTIDYLQKTNSSIPSLETAAASDTGGANPLSPKQNTGGGEMSFEEKETYIINAYENSSQTAKKFLSVFFSKCKTKQADSDFRPIFENFIQDLLITVNKPEWPVSEIILNLLGIILVSQIQNEQNDVGSRVNSLEYLGQIVSQLRKDSLEYQKSPEKVLDVLNKITSTRTTATMSYTDLQKESLNDDEIYLLQRALIKFLDSLSKNDSSLLYAKYFLVGQWLKELNKPLSAQQLQQQSNDSAAIMNEYGQEKCEKHAIAEENRKRLYFLVESSSSEIGGGGGDSDNSNICDLSMSEAFILSKYLCSLKKTLDKNFDYYLVNILSLSGAASSDQVTPTQVRSKAIKCLSLIIEADPQILLKPKVFSCVEANFLHQTISVREASVDLVGRFITLRPELTNHYYKLLSDRILDVGVSVRKRVIKIFRDICLNQPDFEHLAEICVKILKRINDEDGIKKLVIDTFYSIWFSPIASSTKNHHELLLKRVLNIVDAVSEFNSIATNAQSAEIFEQLFNSLIAVPKDQQQNQQGSNNNNFESSSKDYDYYSSNNINASGSSSSAAPTLNKEQEEQLQKSKEVLKSCKQIVDCLIENVLNTEANTNSAQAYKRLVASFSTMYLLSKIKPENFINHAETLLPYLNIKSTNQNDNQIINSAARILECVIPLLISPSNSFLITLEESLCKLIFQGGVIVVSSCISCLGTVVNKLTKNFKLAADCFTKFFNHASFLKKSLVANRPLEPQTKAPLFRALFTLGLLSKHFDVESEELAQYKICTKQELFAMFFYFIRNFDAEVQQRSLTGLGSFLTRYSDYMMKDEVKNLYLTYIKSPNTSHLLKSQVFTNLTDYLNEEDQRNLAKSQEMSKLHCKDDLKEMLDVQSGMASTIIQSYLKPILDSYLTPNQLLRGNVFNCLSQILTQGLVYPIECVPYLIAMSTDVDKKIQNKSLSHLTNLQKAHPGFVQSKSIAGVYVSFMLQRIIKKAQLMASAAAVATTTAETTTAPTAVDSTVRGFTEQTQNGEVLSMNHHLYTLLRVNRSYRRAFAQQLLKMFDDSSSAASASHHNTSSLSYLLYITDNLAYFPYQLMDEPLFIIHQIDMIISVTGVNLLQTFKENLLNYVQPQAPSAVAASDPIISRPPNALSSNEFDLDCPAAEEIEGGGEKSGSTAESAFHKRLAAAQAAQEEDEETLESVVSNMPAGDLKPLKESMYKAQGCCLLLILKQFLKEVYSINDSKIQNYSPNETAKVNDRPITSRKTNRRFNPKPIIEYMNNFESNSKKEVDDELKQSLAREYLEFKELMLSIDSEENKPDEYKSKLATASTNAGAAGSGTTTGATASTTEVKLTALQQRLFEGIEKTKGGNEGGQSSANATPRKQQFKKKQPNSSAKKSSTTPSKAKRKRKRGADSDSDDSDFYADDDNDLNDNDLNDDIDAY